MKKITKRVGTGLAALCLCAAASLSLTACNPANDIPDDNTVRGPYTYANYDGTEVQGIATKDGITTITIGNTAATTGAYASVGVPFNYGLEAWLWNYETLHPTIKFDFKHYDDEFTSAKGLQFTQQLVETDKVFALVGHFGTNTIEATVDYITEKGVPMVYAATGVNSLYNETAREHERAVISVQPIYKTEGRSMLATAVVAEKDGGLGGSNVGVIYTSDDAGISIATGIKAESEKLGVSVYYQKVDAAATDYSSAVNAMKRKGCDVVIIAAAQAAFSQIATQFVSSSYSDVDLITSYVSANGVTMGALADAGVMDDGRTVYAGAWLDIIDADGLAGFHQEYWNFAGLMNMYETYLNANDKWNQYLGTVLAGEADITLLSTSPYAANSYAMAGYVAGATFTAGLDRIIADPDSSVENMTWLSYIEAMESAPVNIPMTKGQSISLANGSRLGITSLALSKYTKEDAAGGGSTLRGLTPLETLEAAYNK